MLIDRKRETRTFESREDVLDVVDLIIEETKEVNEEQGKNFDLATSVVAQIPHFACPNVLLDINIQRDIERYVYCDNFKVPPYKGSYGDQPVRWVNKAFSIKSALAKKEKKDIESKKRKG